MKPWSTSFSLSTQDPKQQSEMATYSRKSASVSHSTGVPWDKPSRHLLQEGRKLECAHCTKVARQLTHLPKIWIPLQHCVLRNEDHESKDKSRNQISKQGTWSISYKVLGKVFRWENTMDWYSEMHAVIGNHWESPKNSMAQQCSSLLQGADRGGFWSGFSFFFFNHPKT